MYLKHNRNIKIISKLQVYHDTLRPTYQLLLPDGLVGPAMMNGSVLGTVYCHLGLGLTHFAWSFYWIVHLPHAVARWTCGSCHDEWFSPGDGILSFGAWFNTFCLELLLDCPFEIWVCWVIRVFSNVC